MNNDLTILPIQPPESEKNPHKKELHPHLPDIYKAQLIVTASPIRSGKTVLLQNCLMNPNFYDDCFNSVTIISNTIFNCATSRFAAEKWKSTCFETYDDKIIFDLIKKQKEKKKIEGADTSYALILDDICGDLNKHGRKGGAAVHFATRFRHFVDKGQACLYWINNQKYNDVATIIRNNMTGLFVSGMLRSKKEIETIKYDIADTFGGDQAFDEYLERARQEPYSWLYFRLDSQPPEVYLNFKEKLYPK